MHARKTPNPETPMDTIHADGGPRARRTSTFVPLLCAAVLVGCDADGPTPPLVEPVTSRAAAIIENELVSILDLTNAALAAEGANIRVASAEYITNAGSHAAGAMVIAKDVGSKRLPVDFVPNDPRREGWSGPANLAQDDITYAIDRTGDAVPPGGGLSAAQTTAAIQRGMATWEGARCSNLPIVENPDFGLDIGVIAFQNGLGGTTPFVFADVQHAGWRDINFVDGVLGATFTFIFIDLATGEPSDVNGDGLIDAAFREIYYDPSWVWAIDAGPPFVDVESIVLHEAGHGLSQGHFGTVFIKNNGSLKAAPRAVMNALYSDVQQSLLGTDNGGHCSIWANWPRR
jgi:hypothetical protein